MSAGTARPSAMRDLLAAGLALLVGAGALWGTAGMSNLGSVFPTAAAAVLIGAAVLLAARTLIVGPTVPPEARVPPRPEWWRLAAAMAILLAWALLLKPLGFLVTSAVGMALLGPVVRREPMGTRAVLLHLAAGTVMLVGFWLLMARVLRIAVPSGTWF